MVKAPLVQIVVSLSAIIGTGFTVIVYSNGVPAHPSAIGVIVYTKSWSELVLFVIVWAGIAAVVPEDVYPERLLLSVAIHENVVPDTSAVVVNSVDEAPEHIDWDVVVFVIIGVWPKLIVTVSEAGVSQLEPRVTVMLYVPNEFNWIVGSASEAVVELANE